MQSFIRQLEAVDQFDYFLSYGNTLGELGDIARMDEVLSRALNVAGEQMGDGERCAKVWSSILAYGVRAEAWEYVAREGQLAVIFAKNNRKLKLLCQAMWWSAVASKNLGFFESSRQQAAELLSIAERVKSEDLITKATSLLNELEARPSENHADNQEEVKSQVN